MVYSPYSVHSVLAMTSLGARGKTATEMKQALGITSLADNTHEIYKKLISDMNSVPDVKLNTGNAIFVNPAYEIVPQFVADVESKYFAKAGNIDLSAPGGPEEPINTYVANATGNMIQNLLPKGSIDSMTVMLLINTIFFNGTWRFPFPKYRTFRRPFYSLDGGISSVDMMRDDMTIKYKKDNSIGIEVVELPFNGERFHFYIALPEKVNGIKGLEKFLATPGNVDTLFGGLSSEHLDVSIPKFKTETTLYLVQPLKDIGMVEAFIPGYADFTGIRRKGEVFISQVIHNAIIDVKETGTVAAAATAVQVRKQVRMASVPNTRFVADHPFLFFIRDELTQQILFQGKFSG
ncbi:leukocyte elastase inhibitor-like [Physella acuta]|uniref:leukocyte elastase inhibitor-like n=1 Tax=Physella acuta TaxID=109671 RepID=UPI0027DC5FCE|nr:leukocyte elastase inhibitor-like [Physella acuta]